MSRPFHGLRKVRVTPEILASALVEGNEIHRRIRQGLPPGARLIVVEQFHLGGTNAAGQEDLDVSMVFEHESWEATEDGSIPELRIVVGHGACTRYGDRP